MSRLHLFLTLANFVLLVPGVILPVYGVEVTTHVEASLLPAPVDVTVYQQTRSILGTIRELWASEDRLVAFLILFFSIIVPVLKATALFTSLQVKSEGLRRRLVRVVDSIGKWSMADVFVVAVLLAFLATRDQAQANTFTVPILLQEVEVAMNTQLTSTLHPGFYFFLGYCLLSIFWTQLLQRRAAALAAVGSPPPVSR
jgi:hypothetical protein